MKINTILVLFLTLFVLSSCGSQKKIKTTKGKTTTTTKTSTTKTPTKKISPIKEDEKLDATSSVKVSYANVKEYIGAFKETAKINMKNHGVPASIILAQGILESGSGNGTLSKTANNHFGIKCHKDWEGDKVYHDDDEAGECFRKYKDAAESYKDHALFLTSRSRYKFLFELNKSDYISWAKGLKQAGYATDPNYPTKLISLIEKYELHQYDKEVLGKDYNFDKTQESKVEITKNDESKPIANENEYIVQQGDTLYSISKKFNTTVDVLVKINNIIDYKIALGQKLKLK